MTILTTLAVLLLSMQSSPVPKDSNTRPDESKGKIFFEYRDTAHGITFKMDNGHVELTVPGPVGKNGHQEFVTYKANSLEDFKRQHPEVAKQYDMDKFIPHYTASGETERWWDLWSKRLGLEEDRFQKYLRELPKDLTDESGHLDRWFDEEHHILRDLERRLREERTPVMPETSKASPSHFGVRVGAVGDPLRVQLGLNPREGLMVDDVQKGSIADSSGVKKYDVLIKISGQVIEDMDRFRDQMIAALQLKEFTLEIVRHGNPLTLTVHPAHS